MGLATASSGKYEQSIEKAKKAIVLDPDDTLAYASLAFSQLHLDQLSDAEVTLQRVGTKARVAVFSRSVGISSHC